MCKPAHRAHVVFVFVVFFFFGFEQRQRFELSPGASLLLVDGLVSGREARGERWAFDRYLSRNEIALGGRLALVDALELEACGSLSVPNRLGRFSALAFAVAMGLRFRRPAKELLEAAARWPVPRGGDLLATASPIGDGFVLRAGATSPEALRELLRTQLAFASEVLGEDPFARRW